MDAIRFGDLPVGAKFRLENMWGVKVVPRVCQQSRDFYAGKTPGYTGVSEFHDWNAKTKFMNHGEEGATSLSPDAMVIPLD